MNILAPSTIPGPDTDLTAAAGLLTVFFVHGATQRAVIDDPLEHVVYEAVTVLTMLAVNARTRVVWFLVSTSSVAGFHPFPSVHLRPLVRLLLGGAMTASVVLVVRGISERLARLVWPRHVQASVGSRAGCRRYNDPACSGDDAVVDVLEVFTAALGEEFVYRFALLVIATRFIGLRVAVIVQAVVWALSHTGFEYGYGAAAVVGLGAAGVVYALVVVVTRTIWPAVIAHAIQNFGVAAFDHDVAVVIWIVLAANAVGALAVAAATANAVMKRRGHAAQASAG